MSSIGFEDGEKMEKEEVVFTVWIVVAIVSIAALLYFAQPMSEVRPAWTPESYAYINMISADKTLQIEDVNYGTNSMRVQATLDDNYKSMFVGNDKNQVALSKVNNFGWLQINYLTEKTGVIYTASSEQYGWRYLHQLDKVALAKDGLRMSYSTQWVTTVVVIICVVLIEFVVILCYLENQICYAWRYFKKMKAMRGGSPC